MVPPCVGARRVCVNVDGLAELLHRLAELPSWLAALLLLASTLVSEDLACVAAGLAAATDAMPLLLAGSAVGLGIWLGDLGLYGLGRWLGAAALDRERVQRWLPPERVAACSAGFHAKGLRWLWITRFMPGLRLPAYLIAGALRIDFGRFAATTLAAVFVWTPIVVGAVFASGEAALAWVAAIGAASSLAVVLVLVFWWLAMHVLLPLCSWRGRRLLLGRWRRLTRWEFWPTAWVYPPVLGAILLFALRHRSLRIVTAVNPGIPAGGFVGESKSAILDALAGAGDAIARHRLLPATAPVDERFAMLRAFQADHGFGWPVVLKPDAGQRGSGVLVVRGEDEAKAYLAAIGVDCLVQEYVAGVEFGVFYVRHPDAAHGRITSITEKRFVAVDGDGKSTLEELILAHPRAVCMAAVHCARHVDRLNEVLPAGMKWPLGEIGNHARGAVFVDGAEHLSEELLAAIERIARSFDGFYYGRFDVRAPSAADFRAGRRIKVLELNGATSEPTHIYDPSYGLLHAWSQLIRHWRELFAIGAANARAGARTWQIREVWAANRAFAFGAKGHAAAALQRGKAAR